MYADLTIHNRHTCAYVLIKSIKEKIRQKVYAHVNCV